jgi:hypothetical protein
MVQLVYSAAEIIEDTIAKHKEKEEKQKTLIKKYKNTSVSEVPVEDLAALFFNKKLSEVPAEVQPQLMDYLVQRKAQSLGPLEEGPATEEEKEYLESFAVRRGVALDPISEAESEGISEGARSGVTGFLGRKLGLIKERTLKEEFDRRVKLERIRMAGNISDYYTGVVEGAIVGDPVGAVTGGAVAARTAMTGARMLSQAPKTGAVVGATAGGAGEGAIYGAIAPVYPEFGDSRARNVALSAAAGGVITGVPTAGVSMLTKTPVPPVVQPELAPQPVALQPKALATETFAPRPQQIPKPTPVTGQATFNLDLAPPNTVKMQNLNEQITDLEIKAQGLNRKKRKGINRQIEALKQVRTAEITAANEIAQDLNDKVVEVDKQIQRLAKRRAEIQPSEAGSKSRVERALRREEELAKEKDIILGLDRYAEGGYRINLTDEAYADPKNIIALKNRIQATNNTNTQPDIVLPEPVITGDAVTDAANRAIYLSMSDDVRLGLDAPPALSAAGVRPQTQYAVETAKGVDETAMQRAVGMSPATARREAETPVGTPTGREGVLTKEEIGRVSAVTAATQEQRNLQRVMAMGTEEDVEELLKALPMGNDVASIEKAAEIFKRGVIGKNYDTLVDYVMDVHQNRMLTAIEQAALRKLFIAVENRMVNSMNKLRKLRQEGLADSKEAVDLIEDIYFSTYIANIRKSSATEASRILREMKTTKQTVASNTRKVNRGELITNLFGVECG